MPQLHRLTDAGIARFQQFLDSQKTSEAEAFDADLLVDSAYAVVAGDGPDVPDECSFKTRFDAASGVDPIITAARLEEPSPPPSMKPRRSARIRSTVSG